ncbi:MAG: hypothetical protein JW850_21795 [Thermoflexales bacterium]|nr:hypothetical protein [Thermoflexales bacterium]
MPQLIIKPNDSRRDQHADEIQMLQDRLGQLERLYSDSTLAFKALQLAYEAARVAWYAVKHEGDGGHLDDIGKAFKWVEDHVEVSDET